MDDMKKKFLFFILSVNVLSVLNGQTMDKMEVWQSMKRVADWQIAHMGEVSHSELNWVNATFYLGVSRWAAVAEQVNQDDSYYKWLMRLGRRNYWQ